VTNGDKQEVRLTFAAYHALGGLDGAINQVAEDALADFGGGLSGKEIDEELARLLRRFAVPVGDNAGPAAAQAALTVRPVAFAEATPDDASRRLVEVLVHARLLVSDALSGGDALLRLAHERILTSWKKAQTVIEAHREFFRIRKDVEIEWVRWLKSGRRREFLLRATPLAEAQTVARTYGAELRRELRQFIKSSGFWAWLRQSRTAAIAIGVAIISAGTALIVFNAEQRASGNYEAAKNAADTLVSSIALELRSQKEIRSETLDTIFGVVGRLLAGIQKTADKPQDYATRKLRSGFDSIRTLTTGQSAVNREDEALRRSRATMLYQFAETYRITAKNRSKAIDLATESLAIWEDLMKGGNPPPGTIVGYAMAHMLLADLTRQAIEEATKAQMAKGEMSKPDMPKPDMNVPRHHLEAARRAFETLSDPIETHIDRALNYSQVLTRLGDLDLMSGRLADAEQNYLRAQTNTIGVYRKNQLSRPPTYVPAKNNTYGNVVHEIAWTYRKVGDAQSARQHHGDAVTSYTNEVCVRRYLTNLNELDRLWAEDLGFGLTKGPSGNNRSV
jgi:tetratricopeptide (TPR) repeat protein